MSISCEQSSTFPDRSTGSIFSGGEITKRRAATMQNIATNTTESTNVECDLIPAFGIFDHVQEKGNTKGKSIGL